MQDRKLHMITVLGKLGIAPGCKTHTHTHKMAQKVSSDWNDGTMDGFYFLTDPLLCVQTFYNQPELTFRIRNKNVIKNKLIDSLKSLRYSE